MKLPMVLPARILALLLPIALLACASVPAGDSVEQRLPTDAEVEQYNASVSPDERIICRQEILVGTNIPKRVCRFVQDIQETSQFHRDQLRRVLN